MNVSDKMRNKLFLDNHSWNSSRERCKCTSSFMKINLLVSMHFIDKFMRMLRHNPKTPRHRFERGLKTSSGDRVEI